MPEHGRCDCRPTAAILLRPVVVSEFAARRLARVGRPCTCRGTKVASSLRTADADGERRVVGGGAGISVQQPRFSPDGTRLAFLSDETGWTNLWLAAADGSDAKPLLDENVEHGDPSWGLGQRSYAWSPDGASIVFTRNEVGFGSASIVDVATGDVRPLGKAAHGGLSWRAHRIAAVRSGARHTDAGRGVRASRRRA